MNPLKFSKILIVDDSKAFRIKTKRLLKDAGIGYYFYEAVDGKEGVSQYIKHKPDVVIMDIMMPNVDGVEATKYIMRYDPKAKIIVASTKDNKAIVDAVMNSGGAKDYIIKPFNSADVVMAVSKQLVTKRNLVASESSTKFIVKPLMYNNIQYGTIDKVCDNGELKITMDNNKMANELLEKAQDILYREKYYEIIL